LYAAIFPEIIREIEFSGVFIGIGMLYSIRAEQKDVYRSRKRVASLAVQQKGLYAVPCGI
jgi:hypothetical protein